MNVVYRLGRPSLLGLYPAEPTGTGEVLEVVKGASPELLRSARFELAGNSDAVPEATEIDWCLPFGPALIRRDAAIPSQILDLMKPWGEWVALGRVGGEHFSLYVPSILDAFDHSAAEFWRFPSGSIAEVERYAFRGDALRCPSVFMVSEIGGLFALKSFRDSALDAGLHGIEFVEVWRQTPMP